MDTSCADLKNELALERTTLANERTLLAYLRTSIMLLASGITLVKILRVDSQLRLLGYLLLPISIFTGVIGYLRFRKMVKDLKKVQLPD